MAKVLVKYIGYSQPNEVIEVEEDKVKALLARKDYVLVDSYETKTKEELGEKEIKRIDEFASDLKDDKKRNYSNRSKNKQ